MRKLLGRSGWVLGLLLLGLMVFASGRVAPRATASSKPSTQIAATYYNLPLSFVRNEGEVRNDPHGKVRFFSAGQGYSLFLTPSQAVLALRNGASSRAAVLRMKLTHANPHSVLTGMKKLPGKNNYFVGRNPEKWHTKVPTYARVKYRSVYPGVDLIFYGNQRHLEFDFAVAPGANPRRIAFALAGATEIREDAQGNLVAEVGGRKIWFHKPVIFQPAQASREHPAGKRFVEGGYVVGPGGQVSFRIANYDRGLPLIIDPALSFSTYLGGGASDVGTGIAVDSSGNVYVTGSTASSDFPTASSIDSALSGSTDAFVAKLDPTGSSLVYSTFLGGNNVDQGSAIGVDSSGDAFVAGTTSSPDFPATSGALQTAFGGGQTDAFVAKLNPAGDSLAYATYLGGTGDDTAQAMAVDSSGDAFVVGNTQSTDFPTQAPLQSAPGGQGDAFVSELKPDGSALVYSTYLGGTGADSAQGVALDSTGNAYVTGYTYSTDFPTHNAYQAANAGSADVFVAKVNAAGSALVYSTYLGGTGVDRSTSIAVDASGNAYVAGDTLSTAFPTTSGVLQSRNLGNGDAFVAKLNASGAALAYSTYLGGTQTDQANGIGVDSSGNVYITGYTQSSDFPTLNAVVTGFGGGTCGAGPCLDAFVTELNSGATALVYSTFLGGGGNDYGQALAIDTSGNTYVTGATSSSDFPITASAFQATIASPGGASDVFVAKVNPANVPSVGLEPRTLAFADQETGTTSSPLSVQVTNYGSAALNISSITISGDFAQTNTCGSSVAGSGGTCTINVTFSPTTQAALTGTLTINDNASGSPQTVQLSGTGVAPAPAVGFSPSSLTFPDQTVGTTSAAQTAVLTNTGSATLNITSISTSITDYAETNNCPASLAPGAHCTISVTFTPHSSGTVTGNLTVASNVSGGTTDYPLSGTGVADFTLSTTPSSTILDTTATTATFTVSLAAPASFTGSTALTCSNNGSATCSFSPSSIAAGESSTLTLGNLGAVSPNALTFVVTATSGVQSTTNSVTVQFKNYSLAMTPPLVTVNAGESGTFNLAVTPINGFSGDVAITCSNVPKSAACTPTPSSVTLSGSGVESVSVKVTTTANSMLGPGGGPSGMPPGGSPWIWVLGSLLLFLLAAWASRRRVLNAHRAWVGLALLLLLIVAWASCNNYYFNPITSQVVPPGTPPGVYSLVLSGKSSTITRSASANLLVK